MATWSGDNGDTDRVERAIDEVARRMTERAPDAAFKARVLARIDDRATSRVGWRHAWVLSSLAVTAIVIIAVMVYRLGTTKSDVARERSAGLSGPRSGGSEPPRLGDRGAGNNVKAALPPIATAAAGPEGPDLHSRVRPKPNPTATLSRPSEIDALAPPPITVAALDVDSLRLSALPQADSIQLDPLETIAPITLAPIGEGDRP